ncbi:hypothetical protein [Streptomyces chrestomyceticus]|uniref:hypothetical protein n=1 Tax=Streptomyces chrestomyceticus TaxID=68185 RepID=UPI0033C82B7C
MLDRVRDRTGRIATLAGASVLAGGLFTDAAVLPGLAAAAAAAGIGLATNIKILRGPRAVRATALALYAAPHAGCAALLVGEHLIPQGSGPAWLMGQASAVALWTGATWYLRPGRLARTVVDEAAAQEAAEAAGETAEEETPQEEPAPQALSPEPVSAAARWWATVVATEDGPAPGTVLLAHDKLSERCVAAVIGSATPGAPVPEIKPAGLSALTDIPENLIAIEPVPGRGAGVRLLVLGERPQPVVAEGSDDEQTWAAIAQTAMAGVELIEAATYTVDKELTH